MTKTAVVRCLVRAEDLGIYESVLESSGKFDPLLRGAVRRRAKAAFDAAQAAHPAGADERHVLRWASLSVLGKTGGLDPTDTAAVALLFEPYKKRYSLSLADKVFWPATTAVLGGVLLVALAIIAVRAWPTREDRFRASALGEAFADPLTGYVIASSRGDKASMDDARAKILTRQVRSQIGDDAGLVLSQLLDQTFYAAHLEGDGANRVEQDMNASVGKLNALFTVRGVPAFVDTYVRERAVDRSVWLLGYYAAERADVTVGSKTVRSLRGWRLDSLNLFENRFAHYSTASDAIVVSLDEASGWSLNHIAPALAKGGAFEVTPQGDDEFSSMGRAERKLGESLRREVCARAKLDETDADELATLVLTRKETYQRLTGGRDEPTTLLFKIKDKQTLAGRVDSADAGDLLRIDRRLTGYRASFERIVEGIAGLREDSFAAYHASSVTVTSESHALTGEVPFDDEAARRASGDLASIAGAGELALTDAGIVATEIMQGRYDQGAELSLLATAKELGLSGWTFGAPRRGAAFAEALLGIADKSPADVRQAADRAHTKLFGTPAPRVSRKPL